MTTALILVGPDDRADEIVAHARSLGYTVAARYDAGAIPDRDEHVEQRARQAYERLGFGPPWASLSPEARESYRAVVRRRG